MFWSWKITLVEFEYLDQVRLLVVDFASHCGHFGEMSQNLWCLENLTLACCQELQIARRFCLASKFCLHFQRQFQHIRHIQACSSDSLPFCCTQSTSSQYCLYTPLISSPCSISRRTFHAEHVRYWQAQLL